MNPLPSFALAARAVCARGIRLGMAPSGTSASSPPVWSSLSALLNRSSNSLPRGNSAGDRHDGLRLRSACESHETLLSQRFGSGLSASAKQTKKEKDHAHDADERKAHEEKRDAADAPPAAPAKRSYHVPPVAPDFGQPNITVVGVGGAGCNAINNMISQGLEGVDFLVCNTDAQALSQSLAQSRVQLGSGLTHGLGAGASPEVGEGAARDSIDRVLEGIQSANMAFLTAGMGGGTGTGAAPVIAQALRDAGILTVAVVTTPFRFEGTRRMRIALQGLQELKDHVDTMIVIPNQNLFRIASPRTSLADAFRMADDVLYSGVRSVTDLMVLPGLINLDFADVRAVMSEMGQAMMGTGEAEGEDEARAVTAAEHAIKNPLLDNVSLAGARGVLINITGGPDMTLYEVDAAANRIREEVDEDANIIFGSAFDESMHGRVRVSVVATGIKDFNFDSS